MKHRTTTKDGTIIHIFIGEIPIDNTVPVALTFAKGETVQTVQVEVEPQQAIDLTEAVMKLAEKGI